MPLNYLYIFIRQIFFNSKVLKILHVTFCNISQVSFWGNVVLDFIDVNGVWSSLLLLIQLC